MRDTPIEKFTLPAEAIINALWEKPGLMMDELLDELGLPHWKGDIVQTMEIVYVMEDLLVEDRLRCVRFVSYAPFMRTTHRWFATEHGRIEIIDPHPITKAEDYYLFLHDPYGQWDAKIEECS